jgi:hypothetical protein
LPHAKEVKVQCGGLLGLQKEVHDDETTGKGVQNIHGLIREAKEAFGELGGFPYPAIVRTVSEYEGRRRRNHGK